MNLPKLEGAIRNELVNRGLFKVKVDKALPKAE
jgi:hypothetical protein